MAKLKKAIVKDVMDFSVTFADNGFIIDYRGNDEDDNWTDVKKLVTDVDVLLAEIKDIVSKQ